MMNKNWLIRTRTNHILGPVSRDKVIELLKKNSLQMEDELTSGDGFWFYIREQELIDKYIYGDEVQPFHPMSSLLDSEVFDSPEEEQKSEEKQTEFINVSELRKSKKPSYPEVQESTDVQKLEDVMAMKESVIDESLKNDFEAFENSSENTLSNFKLLKKVLTFNILNVILVLAMVLLLFLVYYRDLILEDILGYKVNTSIINVVHADDIEYDQFIKKKKLN